MPRLLFSKSGDAVWISHLDLMRLFQRAFKRAGLPLTHTQGYNPRPSVSIAMPLSVGIDSQCELLDFDLDGVSISCDEITQKLNHVLIPGITVLKTYESGRKIKDIALLSAKILLIYDRCVPEHALQEISALFRRPELAVTKKSKNGPVQQDIIPLIRSLSVLQPDANTLELHAFVCCQNPSLNPSLLVAAIETYLPEMKADFSRITRLEIFDTEQKPFR